MYDVQMFMMDRSNGLGLTEILEQIGRGDMLEVLDDYRDEIARVVEEEGEDVRSEFLFYELDDVEVLRELGAYDLIEG